MHTEGHDMGKPEGVVAHESPKRDSEHPGYELQDVNVANIVTFLAGLAGFVAIFFVFCFFMGKVINTAFVNHDGPPNKWQTQLSEIGQTPRGTKREDLASDGTVIQKELGAMANAFPAPALESDDGLQNTADLHAQEDLLLDNYSTGAGLPAGAVRIPITKAMQLIVQRGLPQAPASAQGAPLMYGDSVPTVALPLTDGFARTGYELEQMEKRQQEIDYDAASAEAAAQADKK
ncbi:MAG: hypothetical protein V4555_08880 [Acidobacteriota bacterium]